MGSRRQSSRNATLPPRLLLLEPLWVIGPKVPKILVFWTNTIVPELFRRQRTRNKLLSYDITDIWRNFRRRLTSDPRDKVYGVLGLVKLCLDTTIIPSYESDMQAAYLQPIIEDIRTSGTLKMLNHVEDRNSNPNVHGLSSWVPDWSVPILH